MNGTEKIGCCVYCGTCREIIQSFLNHPGYKYDKYPEQNPK